jgi:hypothetical protein
MSLFRKVDAGTWGDARFGELSQDGKILWLYLLTGPEVTSLPGLILAGRAHLAEVMGWDIGRLDDAFGEFAPTEKYPVAMAKADWSRRVVWLPNAFKHNRPANSNVLAGWKHHWRVIPECGLKDEAFLALETFAEQLGTTYTEQFRHHIKNRTQTVRDTVTGTVLDSSAEQSLACARSAPAPVTVSEGVQGEAAEVASQVRLRAATATASAVFAMPDELPLTAEARAAADALGVRDIDEEWVKFRAKQIEKGTSSTAHGWYQGGWGKWIVDAVRYQRRERERDAARGRSDPSTPPTKGPEEHPLARAPRKRDSTPAEFAEGSRRFLAALQAPETASTDEEGERHAV